MQILVDGRFNRSRYDSAKVVDGVAGRLQEVVDPLAITAVWSDAAIATMQPATVAVWVRDG